MWSSSSSCFSAQSRQWLSFLDESLLEELTKPPPILLISPEQQQQHLLQHQQQQSVSFRKELKPLACSEKASRKRLRDETSSPSSSKAVREKIRREKLNDKFLELSSVLEPGRPVVTDKSVILSEAACVVQQLRKEAQHLKESNEKLRDAVRDLKVEKNELREEKLKLKLEKERLEEQLKTFSIPLMSHPATAIQAAAALVSQNQQIQLQVPSSKLDAVTHSTSVPMWQWMPVTATDTSQDSILRPPVA